MILHFVYVIGLHVSKKHEKHYHSLFHHRNDQQRSHDLH